MSRSSPLYAAVFTLAAGLACAWDPVQAAPPAPLSGLISAEMQLPRSDSRFATASAIETDAEPAAAHPPASDSSVAATEGPDPTADPKSTHPVYKRLLTDFEDYYTAPLHWKAENWAFFGSALGAIALSHQFDRDVRDHFTAGTTGLGSSSSDDLTDALPAAALLVGTYFYSTEYQHPNAMTAAFAMAEAAGLSSLTGFALKYAAGRERPYQTTDPNRWGASGSSFPSLHATAAFAIGTVFAESGQGGYRWVTRILGYGVAGFTAYERLRHNDHWLSDVVAGAALGASSAVFVLHRTYGGPSSDFSLVPMDGGLMLAFHTTLH